MITLHRLGHVTEPFELNPDLIVTVEANPDTVITLATGAKVLVAEPPQRVAQAISEYRVQILSSAMRRRHDAQDATPAAASRQAVRAQLAALDSHSNGGLI